MPPSHLTDLLGVAGLVLGVVSLLLAVGSSLIVGVVLGLVLGVLLAPLVRRASAWLTKYLSQ
jgi:predicted PurR-regulated permease PerM